MVKLSKVIQWLIKSSKKGKGTFETIFLTMLWNKKTFFVVLEGLSFAEKKLKNQ